MGSGDAAQAVGNDDHRGLVVQARSLPAAPPRQSGWACASRPARPAGPAAAVSAHSVCQCPGPESRQPGTMMMEVEVTAVPARPPPTLWRSWFECTVSGLVWLEVRADFGRTSLKPNDIWLLPNDQTILKEVTAEPSLDRTRTMGPEKSTLGCSVRNDPPGFRWGGTTLLAMFGQWAQKLPLVHHRPCPIRRLLLQGYGRVGLPPGCSQAGSCCRGLRCCVGLQRPAAGGTGRGGYGWSTGLRGPPK